MPYKKVVKLGYIYRIENTITKDVYIGSTRQKYPSSRWSGGHRRDLRAGRHHSQILQRAWVKYGEKSFVFKIIEECGYVNESRLLEREQHYIDTLSPKYNVSKLANCTEFAVQQSIRKNSKEYIITTPSGQEIEIKNLAKFSRENGLNANSLSGVSKGRYYSHKGFLCRSKGHSKKYFDQNIRKKRKPRKTVKNKRGKEYEIFSPKGDIFKSNCLKRFCRENALSYSSMKTVLYGECSHSKGWRVKLKGKNFSYKPKVRGKKQRTTYFVLNRETGVVFTILGLVNFLREEGLSQPNGETGRSGKYTFSKREDFSDIRAPKLCKKYHLISPSGKHFRIIGLRQFRLKYNLGKGIYDAANGRIPHYKGWSARKLD